MIRVVEDLEWNAGDGFVWIAAETSVARAVRHYLLESRHHPAAWLKAAAYWTRGRDGVLELDADPCPHVVGQFRQLPAAGE
jgi:NADPH-dependent ferric siderophore reductase